MTERLQRLTQKVLRGEVWFESTQPEYNREDIFLPPLEMKAKRAKEYILAQEPIIDEDTALTGYMRLEGDVMGDFFRKSGHENYSLLESLFYTKVVDSSIAFEFQHSCADFAKVIRIGISGFKEQIAQARLKHTDNYRLEFLSALDTTADAIIGWADKCSDIAAKKAANASTPEAKERLEKLAMALKRVPRFPAESFYEAVLALYVVYPFVPDTIGTIDRHFYPFYKKEIEEGSLTKDMAKEYLQELFLMLQFRISIESDRFYRGGESHFCIGGYLPDGSDGFNELSRLVVESLIELPTYIPQISLRWTNKTPSEVLYFMMDMERRDPNKRIAIVNDEPKIKAYTEITDIPYELACRYTMAGCNEPQLPGGVFMGGCDTNGLKPVEAVFHKRYTDIENAKSFDEFYGVFEEELYAFLGKCLDYYNKFQNVRKRDRNFVSSMFFEGSIDRGLSITEGGAKNAVANIQIFGISNVIDSLTVVKQFCYMNPTISITELADAVRANWQGYEEMRTMILKKCEFFGNNSELSNEIGKRYAESIHEFFEDKKSDLGYKFLIGNLIGYNQHNKWFGDGTLATPDGRYSGDIINFGIGQTDGKDREGLTALLSSIVKLNKHYILCGSTVTNILLEEQMVRNDDSFAKLVMLMETFLKSGGAHFQLTYVSKEDLISAKQNPEKHRSLRVRVSGFSDYFRLLNEDLQDEIIKRTVKKG